MTGKSPGKVKITATTNEKIENMNLSGYCYLYVLPVMPGTYYIRNAQNGMYADYGSNRIVKEAEYDIDMSGDVIDQKWIFTYHTADQTYTIRSSRNSSLYLSIDQESDNIVLVDTYSDATRWKVKKGIYGFKLICNTTSSGTQYVLACETDQAIPGASLIQRAYSATDGNCLDEWYFGTFDASLIAIYEEGKDRSGYFNEITGDLESCGYTNVFNNHSIVTKSMYKEEFLEYLGQSRIVLVRTHGSRNSITFKGSQLTANDFSEGILDGVELIIYGACLTGQGGETASNLVTATAAAGARTVIGFNNEIIFDHCNDFCTKFFELYAYYCNNYNEDIDIEDICNEAANYTRQTNSDYFDVNSVVIAGDKTLLIR